MDTLDAGYQIKLLLGQGDDARNVGQYATAESLFAEAARLADEHADWPIRIHAHYLLGDSQRMQMKNEAALASYTWLMSLPGLPDASASLRGNKNALVYIYRSYIHFVEVGRFLPVMPVTHLHQVLDQAENFLRDIAHPEWMHGLRFERGILYTKTNHLENARQEFEAALALRRRDPDSAGFMLGAHINNLARIERLLNNEEEAARLYHKVWDGGQHSIFVRQEAAIGLAWVAYDRARWTEAGQWAHEAIALDTQIESPDPMYKAYDIILDVCLKQNRIAQAVPAAAQLWCWGRRCGDVGSAYYSCKSLARMRLACVRDRLGVPSDPDEDLPAEIPPIPPVIRRRVLRDLTAADRWIARAQHFARRLDAQVETEEKQTNLQRLAKKISDLRTAVERDA